MQFSFRKPHFWHPQNFAKTLFWHNVTLFAFPKLPPKHYKNGQAVKNSDQFLTLDLDQFLTLETPNLGPVLTLQHIYISWWDDKGPGFMYPSGLIRSPFFFKKFHPHRSQKPKNRKFGLSFEELIRSPKNRCSYSGLLVSRTFFRAPYQLLKRFPPQNGRFRANFLKTFKKPPGLLISFSRSAERTTFRSGPQKEAFSKVCRKFDTNCTPHSAERTMFLLTTPKIAPFRRKNDFWPDFQKLAEVDHMRKSRKPWKN